MEIKELKFYKSSNNTFDCFSLFYGSPPRQRYIVGHNESGFFKVGNYKDLNPLEIPSLLYTINKEFKKQGTTANSQQIIKP